jgi:glycosyltransferase involved in cell wall biosynthesis
VRPDNEIALTEVVRKQREQLEEVAVELARRALPITPLEARLLVDVSSARLETVEWALRYAVQEQHLQHARANESLLRSVARRVRSYTHPRIGSLRHYEPRDLLVPAKYARTAPPDPAPTISIVTPSFEQGRFLGRTLHSVLSQEYPALEYVVQDGGSTDETPAVLGRFGPVLTRWVSEPDRGQADAINRGFRNTTGEIMAWLNSDDLLLPGALAYVARYFVEHPDVDVVYGHRLMIDEDDDQIGSWILPAHDDVALTVADYVPQETLFWRRRIWERSGGSMDASYGYALDWDLLLRFRDAGARMVRLPRYLGAFRIHEEQKSTAAKELGTAECARLRERVHGREVPIDEVTRRLQPYFKRHLFVHYRHRLAQGLPIRRELVRTRAEPPPLEPSSRRRDAAPAKLSDETAV